MKGASPLSPCPPHPQSSSGVVAGALRSISRPPHRRNGGSLRSGPSIAHAGIVKSDFLLYALNMQ